MKQHTPPYRKGASAASKVFNRSGVDFVWALPQAVSSPEVELVKERNQANGISPNKISTLLAYGLSGQSCLNFGSLSASTAFRVHKSSCRRRASANPMELVRGFSFLMGGAIF